MPSGKFVPNLDKPTGGGIRLRHNSVLEIGEEPFLFKFVEKKFLCEVPELGGVIRTVAYSC